MAMRPSLDSDTWWHLRTGAWILEQRSVPQTDPFSYTRQGADWQYPGWLVEAPLVLIYRYLGAGGLNLWTALMATMAFMFVWRRLSGGVFLRAFVTILAAAAAGIYWAARPYMVTFLLTAVFLWILEGYRWDCPDVRKAKRRLWWLPVLMIVWANSHGGFITGFILLGVYGLSGLLDLIRSKTALHESEVFAVELDRRFNDPGCVPEPVWARDISVSLQNDLDWGAEPVYPGVAGSRFPLSPSAAVRLAAAGADRISGGLAAADCLERFSAGGRVCLYVFQRGAQHRPVCVDSPAGDHAPRRAGGRKPGPLVWLAEEV